MIRGIRKTAGIILVIMLIASAAIFGISVYEAQKGGMVRTAFIPVDGSAYLDEKGNPGKMLWISWNGKRYYVSEEGTLIRGKRALVDGKEFLFGDDGAVVTSLDTILDGQLVRIRADGEISVCTGWVTLSGKRYFGGENGEPLKGWMMKDGTTSYYLGDDGAAVTNTTFLYQGKIMKADQSGVVEPASGWQKVDGTTYYARQDGSIARNAQVLISGRTVFLDEEGQMVRGTFYSWEDETYYADENGTTRTEEGWLTVDGKEYYCSEGGALLRGTTVTVDGKSVYLDRNGVKVEGKPTIDQYLGCNDIYGWMTDHFSDYYFKTPYRNLYGNTSTPERLIRPYGLYGDDAGMNCTGFISSLVDSSGGDLSKVTAMGRFGGYGNADNYLMLALSGKVRYEVFGSVKELLSSGRAKKGNIFYLAPRWNSGHDCHMGVFWGDTPSENKLWSQTYATKCTVTEIYMVDPIAQIYMFPIERNVED